MTKAGTKIASILLSFNIVVFSLVNLPLVAYAEELPNRDEIRNQVLQEAHSQSTQPSPVVESTPEPEAAAQTDVTNTGDDTTVNNSAATTDTTEINNDNYTEVDQSVDAEANTGYNQANGNISVNGGGAGVIQTGDATVNVVAGVNAGNNTNVINGTGGEASSGSDVVNSGDGLTVNSNASATTYKIVRNRNTTIINQATNASANTGNNEATGNIAVNGGPAGVIVTGNASTNVSYLVTANGNMTIIGGTGESGLEGASIILTNSGRTSRFNNSSNSAHYTTVTNENRALISQSCGRPIGEQEVRVDMTACSSNTGNNHADGQINRNGDAGVIKTGDAAVNVVMNASANNNETHVGGNNGAAGASADVLNTGDGVEVNNSANNTSGVTVNNNNYADVDQSVNARANTGYNTANGNISFGGVAGWIQTGNATVNVIMNADVNNNTTVADSSAGMNSNASNGSSVVNTGDDVTINSSANNSTTIEVINQNVLNLSQRVNSYANTGNNEADGNIGSVAGVIITGDATSTTSMDVHANNNCTRINSNDPCPSTAPENNNPQPTNAPVGGGQVAGATNNNNGGSSSSSSSSSPTTAGAVLGAMLPATGPEAGMMVLALSIGGILAGNKLRKFEN